MTTEETPMPTGEQILPFYIVCDESASMAYNGGIDAINEGLPDLHSAIAADPLVSDKSRIGLIAFSDDAEVVVPLARASDIEQMPGMMEKGATNYGAAFECLQTTIAQDVSLLRNDGYQVFRPAVFFITDGEPTDTGWEAAHAALTDKSSNSNAPNIIAFGVDGSEPSTIGRVATIKGAAFIADRGINPGAALKEIMRSLTQSIVSSTGAAKPQLVVPPPPDGTIAVDLDEI